MQIRKTLFPNQKNRNVYFDAVENMRYFEQKTGTEIGEKAKEIIMAYAEFINEAYMDGYQAGKEAAQG